MNGEEASGRHSIRLRRYDYAGAGAYFVTICTQDRAVLFGEVCGDEMHLNAAGTMVQREWRALPERHAGITPSDFVVMPNHLHGILLVAPQPVLAVTLGELVGGFKSTTTVLYGRGVRSHGWTGLHTRLWQRNFYEHIIRGDEGMARIRQYIQANPARWAQDRENPSSLRSERR